MFTKYDCKNPIPKEVWQEVYSLLVSALPAQERRSQAGQEALLALAPYALYVYRPEDTLCAFLAAWEFETVRFVEHFAVGERLRGQGMGGILLDAYLAQSAIPVVLEVEPAGVSALAARRIAFYERHGFYANAYPYLQQPLNPGDAPMPLVLMSAGGPLLPAQFEAVKALLYKEVYGKPVR